LVQHVVLLGQAVRVGVLALLVIVDQVEQDGSDHGAEYLARDSAPAANRPAVDVPARIYDLRGGLEEGLQYEPQATVVRHVQLPEPARHSPYLIELSHFSTRNMGRIRHRTE
jgi:hypothetical protein